MTVTPPSSWCVPSHLLSHERGLTGLRKQDADTKVEPQLTPESSTLLTHVFRETITRLGALPFRFWVS